MRTHSFSNTKIRRYLVYGLILILIYYKLGPIAFGISGGYQGPKGNQAVLMRYHALVYGLFLFIVSYVYLLINLIGRRKLSINNDFELPFVLYFVAYALLAVIIGLLRGNNLLYLVGDLFKSFVTVSGYFLTKHLLSKYSIKKCIFFFWVLLVIHLLYLSYGFYENLHSIFVEEGFKRHVYISEFAFCASVAMLFSYQKWFSLQVFWSLIFVFITTQHILTLSRNTFLSSVIAIGLIFFLSFDKKTFKKNVLIVFISIIAIIISIVGTGIHTKVPFKRFKSLYVNKAQDTTVNGRMYEIKSALSNLENDFFAAVVGFGYGAQVKLLSEGIPEKIKRFHRYHDKYQGLMHNIHCGYVSILFRTGILGGIIFVWFMFSVAKKAFVVLKKMKSSGVIYHAISVSIISYLAISFIHFGITYILIGNPFIVVSLATLNRLASDKEFLKYESA